MSDPKFQEHADWPVRERDTVALLTELDALKAENARLLSERDSLLSYLKATTDEDGTHHPDWVARAQAAEAREAKLREALQDIEEFSENPCCDEQCSCPSCHVYGIARAALTQREEGAKG